MCYEELEIWKAWSCWPVCVLWGKKKKEKKRKEKGFFFSLILQVWDWDSLMILDLACIRTLNLEIIFNTKKSRDIYYIVSSISGVY